MMPDGPKPAVMERGSGKCKFIHLKITAVICIFTTAILSLIFLVQILFLNALRPSLTMPKESLTCIPCDKIKFNANTNLGPEGRFAFTQRDDGMCCGPAESITQFLLKKEMTAQYRYCNAGQSLIDIAEEYATCERKTNDKQPIAKAVGIKEFKPSYIVDGHHKVLWNKNGLTFYTKKLRPLGTGR